LAELLPGVLASAYTTVRLQADLKRCTSSYQKATGQLDCCRRCDPSKCVPCQAPGAETFDIEDRYQTCVLRAWTRALGRTVGEPTVGAVLASLADAGLLDKEEAPLAALEAGIVKR
jgi:hypothetical protein